MALGELCLGVPHMFTYKHTEEWGVWPCGGTATLIRSIQTVRNTITPCVSRDTRAVKPAFEFVGAAGSCVKLVVILLLHIYQLYIPGIYIYNIYTVYIRYIYI